MNYIATEIAPTEADTVSFKFVVLLVVNRPYARCKAVAALSSSSIAVMVTAGIAVNVGVPLLAISALFAPV